MYAVLAEGSIHFLGADREAALNVLDSKSGATMSTVTTLAELSAALTSHQNNTQPKSCVEEEGPSRLDEVLKRLEEIDLAGNADEVLKMARENGEKAIGQVRSLGLRGLKGLGEGFTALGDLLQQAGAEEEESEQPPTPPTEE